jgi:hypothetical protein
VIISRGEEEDVEDMVVSVVGERFGDGARVGFAMRVGEGGSESRVVAWLVVVWVCFGDDEGPGGDG